MLPSKAKAARPPSKVKAAHQAEAVKQLPVLPFEFAWRDYVVYLLHVGAEIEHSLMVQYLYAAWSLGGPHLSVKQQEKVAEWQREILGIAKEEMGHLITVQNLLRLIGGPLNFERDEYPFQSEFYPFNFTLERLTLKSLAKYVWAESPPTWSGKLALEIKRKARHANRGVITPVGKLYGTIIELMESTAPAFLAERDFQAHTAAAQASPDDWARGYQHSTTDARVRSEQHHGTDAVTAGTPRSAQILIQVMRSRQEAVEALVELSEQGEGTTGQEDPDERSTPSHFARFLKIYRELKRAGFDPSRPVPQNPKTVDIPDSMPGGDDRDMDRQLITNREALGWAHLFNIRYRLLLMDLTHALSLAGQHLEEQVSAARGSLINWTFGEMYNLRAIGGILMECPLRPKGDARKQAAGPPFDMPYSLILPDTHADRWRLHRDLLEASGLEIDTLQDLHSGHAGYLSALAEADKLALEKIKLLMSNG